MDDPVFNGLMLAWGAYGIAVATPGANTLAVIGTAMAEGRRNGLILAAGMVTGTFVWAVLSLLGLTALLTLYAGALTLIKWLGAAYLLYIAIKSFRSALVPHGAAVANIGDRQEWRQLATRGLLIQLSNPKAALSWIAIMSLSIGTSGETWIGPLTAAGCLVLSLIAHTAYALIFSAAPVARAYLRLRRGIEAGLGVFFCFASWKLATSRL